jgi:hypothetical protein
MEAAELMTKMNQEYEKKYGKSISDAFDAALSQ